MSDFSSTPPQAQQQFDFARPFAFPFKDPQWVTKVLIGGLFYLAAFLLVGIFFVFGYCARLARNVVAGNERLPEWDDLGEYFSEGLRLFAVGFVYVLPMVAVVGIAVVPLIIAEGFSEGRMDDEFAGGMVGCMIFLITPFSLLLSFWLPGALLFAALEQRFSAAFEFRRIFQFIKTNFLNYLLAFVVYMVARTAAGIGIFLLCIGVFFTGFLGLVISSYAFAYAYRLAKNK